ncbi:MULTISPECIES: DeoR/GlpR family DNA-binding transcription regulator [unclassified Rhizobium]|uniref:DeoR/GlpR family DNA-binding transcription regulator n=1 Tax=unclassified Rhizobium TaxID=2613769 RepID=UPI001ADB10B3|nr:MULTISPECIES: DeoR/GlpR family DNA-binding transcription regulator [unclassified Rhizobium]MBO9127295.1 DeoR/GlpR transcriptional regulator [Rhizobium sp. 16-488-2b]MBO9177738.1 DeoR/GlpR transcriptional regulator [Rhizobium sp. 16-488-2a]
MKLNRLDAIRSHLYSRGPTSINELARAMNASLATIRRDLAELEEAGTIDRLHGGARLAQGSSVEIDFDMREQQNIAEKRAIATAAYERIKPHGSVFLDAGTTVLQVANLLRIEPLACLVFTNGLRVAQELFNVPKARVNLIGGSLRNENASFVGPLAEQTLRSIYIETLMLGIGAIADDGMIYSIDSSEAQLNALMIERSSEHVILATAAKFGHRSTFAVGPIPKGATVITSVHLSEDWQNRIRDWGCELVLTQPNIAAPIPLGEVEAC